jgi:hypothetical protein
MILETAQMLSTAHRLLDGQLVFKQVKVPVYKKNPLNAKEYFIDPETKSKVLIGYKDKLKKHWELYDSREPLFYKVSHVNHPSSIWTRTSVENYNWLVDHLFALGNEYTFRYGKKHLTLEKLGYMIQSPPRNLRAWDWTPMPSCMDKEYIISDDPIINYRNYYRNGKKKLHNWKDRQPPEWIL